MDTIITGANYLDFYRLIPSFVSLDISVTSTGWARWVNGELTYGSYSLQAPTSDGVARRKEFREFLKGVFGDHKYTVVFVEDIIGGVNFITNRELAQLNPIVDDLIDQGVLFADRLIREDNNAWKRFLRLASGFQAEIRGSKNVKKDIQTALSMLGFVGEKGLKEDVYDALGIAIGCITKYYIKTDAPAPVKLKTNIMRGYGVKQFDDYIDALMNAEKSGRKIITGDFTNMKKGIRPSFAELVESVGDDTPVFLISVPVSGLGMFGIEKGLDISGTGLTHLVVSRKLTKNRE